MVEAASKGLPELSREMIMGQPLVKAVLQITDKGVVGLGSFPTVERNVLLEKSSPGFPKFGQLKKLRRS